MGIGLPIVREIREGFQFQLPDDAVGRIRKPSSGKDREPNFAGLV